MNNSEPAKAKILIVDDVQDNLDVLSDLLSYHGYNVETALNGEDAISMAVETQPELILLDILMPRMDGFEVCTRLKLDPATRAIPVIFVSSLADMQNTVKGFQIGGADYITKPFQQAETLARIKMHIMSLRMQKQLEAQNAKLIQMANTDFLTGINNRRHFFNIAEAEFVNALRTGTLISITIFDVDHYKTVNDTHGHLVGDQVLTDLAQVISSQTRPNDITARYGGDEFVILHPALEKREARQIAEVIRKKVEEAEFASQSAGIRLTISAGVEDTRNCIQGSRFDDVLSRADRALYTAKRTGRNRVIAFEETPE